MRKKDNMFAVIMALVMAAALSMTSAADIVHAGEEPGKREEQTLEKKRGRWF